MPVTLDQILALAGRLDDLRGFDTPRERFRRFLREYVTDVTVARALADECRHAPDDQHQRALDDIVTLLGRFIGFDIAFGVPVHVAGRLVYQGTWLSPGRLRVVLDVGSAFASEPLSGTEFAEAVAALDDSGSGGVPAVGLFVPGPLAAVRWPDRATLSSARVRQIALDDLLTLAERASGGRLEHADAVRVFESGIPVDFVVGLLDRPQATPSLAPADAPAESPETAVPVREGSGYWMATVAADYATTPEEFLELVVAKRHVFGVTDRGTVVGTVRSGDSICFYLPGKGVVGHARVASVTEGAADIRDARRFRQVLRLEGLALHLGQPVALDAETELRLRAAPVTANRHAQRLLEISPEGFAALSGRPGDAHAPEHRDRLSG